MSEGPHQPNGSHEPPPREPERLFKGMRTAVEIGIALVLVPVLLVLELVSGILMVIGIVTMIAHLRANPPRDPGMPRAPLRRRPALAVAIVVMWVLDHPPFGNRSWRRKVARPDRQRI